MYFIVGLSVRNNYSLQHVVRWNSAYSLAVISWTRTCSSSDVVMVTAVSCVIVRRA